MSTVVQVEIGSEVSRHRFERTFMIGTEPSCDIQVHDVREPYTVAIFVLPDRATFGAGSRVVPVMLDGRGLDIDNGRRHRLYPGNVLVMPGATITIEQVPSGPPMFEHEGAREFDHEVDVLIANEPPPRPRIDSFELSMDHIARTRPADPARFASLPPRTLGDLEAALGLAFPTDLYVQSAILTSRGQPTDHAVASVSARLAMGMLRLGMGFIEEVRHSSLENYRVQFSHGRTRCESVFASTFGAPLGVSDSKTQYRVYGPFLVDAADADAFTLEWSYNLPDWAVPCDVELRARWLSELAAMLTSCSRRDDLVARLGSAPPNAGIRVKGVGDSIWIELAPTIAAPELVLALGWPDLVWKRADGFDDVPYILVNGRDERGHEPHVGRWRVQCCLDGHFPSGPELPQDQYLHSIVMTDRIRHIKIG